ncbi:MAG: TIGR00282 family metallophosphoesterase [Candidatus Kapabacteria bacterium]|nr:TIGR00282 family metallophosphoesterase [Candidatus Kapabacteria bacterium]MBX7153498.1 TIGR00282 family metallophosphoesterase [Bacteroidota bacterium]
MFIGDVVGEPALKHLCAQLTTLATKHNAEFVIVNGENVWDGKGINEQEAQMLFDAGAHVITTGNHIWENWKSRPLLATNNRVLRPINYPRENPGRGITTVALEDGLSIAVLQLQGRVYMQPIDCPFKAADNALQKLAAQTNIIIVDFHAEATAEKIAMGWHLDGRVSAVLGTHTHIQTNDARILPNGTAYITDVGMTGPYNSVVGMSKEVALKRFMLQTAHKYELAKGDYRINGAVITINADSGKAESITPITEYCGDDEVA